jgi:hypothetical protein
MVNTWSAVRAFLSSIDAGHSGRVNDRLQGSDWH